MSNGSDPLWRQVSIPFLFSALALRCPGLTQTVRLDCSERGAEAGGRVRQRDQGEGEVEGRGVDPPAQADDAGARPACACDRRRDVRHLHGARRSQDKTKEVFCDLEFVFCNDAQRGQVSSPRCSRMRCAMSGADAHGVCCQSIAKMREELNKLENDKRVALKDQASPMNAYAREG